MYRLRLKDNVEDSDDVSDSSVGDASDESIGSNVFAVDGDVEKNFVSDSVFSSGYVNSVFPVDAFTFLENNVIVGNINQVFFNYSVCSISLLHK